MRIFRSLLNFLFTGRGYRRELEGKQRLFVGLYALIIVLLNVGLLARQLWGMDALVFLWLHFGLFGSLAYLLYTPWKPERKISAESFILAGVLVALLIYQFVNMDRLLDQAYAMLMPGTLEQIIGWVTIFLILEGVRRCVGFTISLILIGLAVYSLTVAGAHPNSIVHSMMFMGLGYGVWGHLLEISAYILLPVFVFAGLFTQTGAAKAILYIAGRLFGKASGGAGKISVVASAAYGMSSGGAAENVAVTGSFTIPAMLRSGFRPKAAGAIESVASTGGTLTPPVMAGTVFVMAALIGIPYASIISHVIPVMVIFYMVLFLQVHWMAKIEGIGGVEKGERVPILELLKLGSLFFAPLIILVTLMLLHFTMSTSFLSAAALLVVLLFAFNGRRGLRMVIDGLISGGYDTAWLVFVMTACGMFVSILGMSGLDMDLILWAEFTFGGNLVPILIIGLVLSFVIGMTGAITPAYILVAMLIIPAIIRAGVPLIPAHLFALYYAVMAWITPPVCIACFIAAKIANVSFWKVGWEALKFSLVLWILPWVFVYRPELILVGGDSISIAQAFVTAAAGCILLAASIRGMFFARTGVIERIVLFAAAACLLIPQPHLDLVGGVLAILVIVWNVMKWLRQRREVLQSP